MMPTVNEANPSLLICAARQRVSRHCPRGTSCLMIHNMDVAKWPDATFAKWAALVNKMPALDWNHKVVDLAKISARTAKLSGASLSGATTAKNKP